MIKQLSIRKYKGFYNKEIVKFAQPDNETLGSGLTVIVGPNNTGKTTIIESILISKDKRFRKSERNGAVSPKITITNHSNQKCTFTSNNSSSPVTSDKEHGIIFELIPSRRYWNYKFHGEWDHSTLTRESVNSNIRNSANFDIGPLLKKVWNSAALKAQLNAYLKQLIPHFTDWTIDTNDANEDYIKYKTNKTFHNADLLGDGVISLFRIIAHLINPQQTTLIIDEPELSLHPATQKILIRIISEVSKNKQIILCTHSPYFLRFEDIQNGAKIARTNKVGDKMCTISNIDKSTLEKIEKVAIKNRKKPYSLGIVAKEIFFTNSLVFVEGQEDVGILKYFAYEYGITPSFEFFGYGVDGAGNIEKFLELSQELQITVGAIFDQDKAVEANRCRKNFPDYASGIVTISKDDIRDKFFDCPKCKEKVSTKIGLFDEKGNIKSDAEKEEVTDLFTKLNEYFESKDND